VTARAVWGVATADASLIEGEPVTLSGLPPSPAATTVANLIYFNGAEQPSFAILWGVAGPYEASREKWRLLQLLQRSNSRFV